MEQSKQARGTSESWGQRGPGLDTIRLCGPCKVCALLCRGRWETIERFWAEGWHGLTYGLRKSFWFKERCGPKWGGQFRGYEKDPGEWWQWCGQRQSSEGEENDQILIYFEGRAFRICPWIGCAVWKRKRNQDNSKVLTWETGGTELPLTKAGSSWGREDIQGLRFGF